MSEPGVLFKCHTLPPSLDGKLQGYLQLKVDAKLTNKYSPVNVGVVVKWWGESDFVILRPWESGTKPKSHRLFTYKYDIRTSKRLFDNYLKDCKFIRFNFMDNTFNTLISTVEIRNVTAAISQFGNENNYPVFDIFHEKIGDVTVEFSITLKEFLEQSSRPSLKLLAEIIEDGKKLQSAMMNSITIVQDAFLSEVPLIGGNARASSLLQHELNSQYGSRNESRGLFKNLEDVMLSDQPNKYSKTDIDDRRVESQSSGTQTSGCSVQRAVKTNLKQRKDIAPEVDHMEKVYTLCDKVNHMRIKVISLKLNDNGEQKVHNSQRSAHQSTKDLRSAIKYFVRHEYPPLVTTEGFDENGNGVNGANSTRFVSSQESVQHGTVFDASSLHLIPRCVDSLKVKLSDQVITFTISTRRLNHGVELLLGRAYFQLSDLWNANNLSQVQYLPIIGLDTKNKDLYGSKTFGSLKVEISLGINGFFKDDMLQADNYFTAESWLTSDLTLPPGSMDLETIERESNVFEKVKVVHQLLSISKGCNLPDKGLFLKWQDLNSMEPNEMTAPCMPDDHEMYHFHVHQKTRMPLSKNLLNRCENNLLIVEVWQHRAHADNTLLGILHLPLHNLYANFADESLLLHRSESECAIVAVEDWLPVIQPVSQAETGRIFCHLSWGTEGQITREEEKHGIWLNSKASHRLSIPPQDMNEEVAREDDDFRPADRVKSIECCSEYTQTVVISSVPTSFKSTQTEFNLAVTPSVLPIQSPDPSLNANFNCDAPTDSGTQAPRENRTADSGDASKPSTNENGAAERPPEVADRQTEAVFARVDIDSAKLLPRSLPEDESVVSSYVSFLVANYEAVMTQTAPGMHPQWKWNRIVKLSCEKGGQLFQVIQSTRPGVQDPPRDILVGMTNVNVMGHAKQSLDNWYTILDSNGVEKGKIRIIITLMGPEMLDAPGEASTQMLASALGNADITSKPTYRPPGCPEGDIIAVGIDPSPGNDTELHGRGHIVGRPSDTPADPFASTCFGKAFTEELLVITTRLKRRLEDVTNVRFPDHGNIPLLDAPVPPMPDDSCALLPSCPSLDGNDHQSKKRCTETLPCGTEDIYFDEDYDDDNRNDIELFNSFLTEVTSRQIQLDNVFNPQLFHNVLNSGNTVAVEQSNQDAVFCEIINTCQDLDDTSNECDTIPPWRQRSAEVHDTSRQNTNLEVLEEVLLPELEESAKSPPIAQSTVPLQSTSRCGDNAASTVSVASMENLSSEFKLACLTTREGPEGGNCVVECSVGMQTTAPDLRKAQHPTEESGQVSSSSRLVEGNAGHGLNQDVIMNKDEVNRIAKIFNSK